MFRKYCSILKKSDNLCFYVQIRLKTQSRSAKTSLKLKALEHFDDFYKEVFYRSWPSIRIALLCEHKYAAVVNNYSETERIIPFLENHGAVNLKRLFEVESTKLQQDVSLKKRGKMKNIFKLDKKLEELGEKKKNDEIKSIYPSKDKINEESTDLKGLNSDELSDRYIDPSVSTSSLYEFVPATKLKGSEDWLPESQHFSYYSDNSDFPVRIEEESHLNFPEHLKVYSFPPGVVSEFPSSQKGLTGVSDYYLLDGGSVMPVLALDLQPGDSLLDMCAAPGGKSLIALQTLHTRNLLCNDVSESRLNRVKRVFKEFLYDYPKKVANGEIEVLSKDARFLDGANIYNKILVDVPCTIDRHSVMTDDNNIFKPTRLKERINVPELQSQILTTALKLVPVGGTVVYSTCSLSPIQNDGVVHMALGNIWQDTDSEIVVIDMKKALEPTKVIYKYSDIRLRYGHLIVPYLPNNFGPTYFCKFIKVK